MLFTLIEITVSAQGKLPQKDSGVIQGARFAIDIPSNWNKGLVLYAHGYHPEGSAPTINSARDSSLVRLFTSFGFAFARSEYVRDGWVLAEGIEDIERLRKHFISKYGKPDTTFIAGHSMGGGITVATIEKYGQHYNGALAMCPLTSNPYDQLRQSFDLIAVFNVLYPNVLPSLSEIMSAKAIVLNPAKITEAINKDSSYANQLANRFFFKPKDLPMMLMFGHTVLKNIVKVSGGNPFDNTNTVYNNYGPDWRINEAVERLSASKGAMAYLKRSERTGIINKPVVMMHTIYDQIISPAMGVVNFDNRVNAAGKGEHITVFYTPGEGHCNFSDNETKVAFNALRTWAYTKTKPLAGPIN